MIQNRFFLNASQAKATGGLPLAENYTALQKMAFAFIRFYQRAVSPHIPPCCRYHPTCSEYAFQAVEKHGFFRGSFLAIKRILRCHPFSRGGYDPV